MSARTKLFYLCSTKFYSASTVKFCILQLDLLNISSMKCVPNTVQVHTISSDFSTFKHVLINCQAARKDWDVSKRASASCHLNCWSFVCVTLLLGSLISWIKGSNCATSNHQTLTQLYNGSSPYCGSCLGGLKIFFCFKIEQNTFRASAMAYELMHWCHY